jgi:NAD(P)-dependent dehydrogenase (short-subunit alcohol dehydrogenase family)
MREIPTLSFATDLAAAIPATIPRAALVTGGARRIGRAIALALAEAGFDVAIHFRESRAEAETLAEAIEGRGAKAALVQADLAEEARLVPLLEEAAAALGPLGVLVNNASLFERDEWYDVTRESWTQHMEVNLRAPFVLAQGFAKALPAAKEGVIVNLLDQRVFAPTGHFISYTLSKAGLWTLTQTLALALAPRIRVFGIGPGPTLPSPRQSPDHFAAQVASLPLKRPARPEEVASAVLMGLMLPSFTGQMIALDGGQHLMPGPAVSIPE